MSIRPAYSSWPRYNQRLLDAGEPGADTTRFTDAGNNCPGDNDLEQAT